MVEEGRNMRIFKVISTIIALIILSAGIATAESFAERFKKFVLGSDAEAYYMSMNQSPLDGVAEGCLGCHDGIKATHITVKNSETPLQIRGIQTVNHPVGMSYDDYTLKNPRGYRPRPDLPSSILFVDGKVTCISCHSLKEDRTQALADSRRDPAGRDGQCSASNRLTMGPRETDLCMTCHVK